MRAWSSVAGICCTMNVQRSLPLSRWSPSISLVLEMKLAMRVVYCETVQSAGSGFLRSATSTSR